MADSDGRPGAGGALTSRQGSGDRRGPLDRVPPLLVAVIFGAVAATSDAQPTGIAVVDPLWCGLVVTGVAATAARGRRWSWFVAGGIAGAAVDGGAWQVVAILALLLAVAPDVRRVRAAGVVVGGCAVLGAMHQPSERPLPWTALWFVATAVPLVASGVRQLRRRDRRRVARVAAAGAVVLVGIGLAFTVMLVQSRDALDQGQREARAGLTAAREADSAGAAGHLADAADAFDDAHDSLSSWWARPAQLLPGVRQQVETVRTMSEEGTRIADDASVVLAAGGDQVLAFDDGAVDLARLTDIGGPLEVLATSLTRAESRLGDADGPLVLPFIEHRLDELRERVDETIDTVTIASEAANLAPELLGAAGPRRYLVAFVTPTEARGRTGFMGNYGELVADEGHLELTVFGKTSDLEREMGRQGIVPTLPDLPDYVARYGRFQPDVVLRNITMSPDFPSVAEVLEHVYPQVTGTSIDGVIALDPTAIAALLRFTGPVPVPGVSRPLTFRNAEEYLLVEQYVRFAEDLAGREDVLEDAARLVFDRIDELQVATGRELIRFLGPVIEGGHFVLHSGDAPAQGFLERAGLSGRLPPVVGDFLGVVSNNASGNKIDIFLERRIDYDLEVDLAAGFVEGTITVELRNTAPTTGLPDNVIDNRVGEGLGPDDPLPIGFNRTYLSVYTPLTLLGSRVDGAATPLESQVEAGRWVYSKFLDIGPGGTVTVELDVAGPLDLVAGYRLDLASQPLVHPDEVTVAVRFLDGRPAAGGGFDVAGPRATASLTLEANRTLVAPRAR